MEEKISDLRCARDLPKIKAMIEKYNFLAISEARINELSEQLILKRFFASIADKKMSQCCGSSQATLELRTLVELSVKLANHINVGMHKTSLEAIHAHEDHLRPSYLAACLRTLVFSACQAIEDLAEVADEQKRKPKKQMAKKIMIDLAEIYTEITGRHPSRIIVNNKAVSEFQLYIQDAFNSLEIANSAESQIRDFMEKKPT